VPPVSQGTEPQALSFDRLFRKRWLGSVEVGLHEFLPYSLDGLVRQGHDLLVVEVVGTDEFAEWFLGLNDADAEAVVRVVGLLEARGTVLGFPYTSAITSSQYPLRELRIQCAFDPKRQAVLLIGGDKTGDERFYDRMVPKAEAIWEQYLQEQGVGDTR
jgi:hypothetical protein